MNKKNQKLLSIILSLLLLFSIAGNTIQTNAQDVPQELQSGDFTFEELGWDDALLEGPLSSTTFSFNLPGHLRFTGDLTISLDTELILELSASTTGYLRVYANGLLVDVLAIARDVDKNIKVTIPLYILRVGEQDGIQEIEFLYQNDDCDRDSAALLHIKNESIVTMAFAESAISTDIRNFPYPFYMDSSLPTLVETYLILPDSPNQETLLAVMNASAALGALFNGSENFQVKSWADVTPAEKENNHFVFIGQYQDFPTEVQAVTRLDQTVPQGNGYLELHQSPWNKSRGLFVITSNSEEGLLLASKSILYDELRIPYNFINVALIKDLNIDNSLAYNPEYSEITIDTFGYDNRTSANVGLNWINYSFYIPFGYKSTENSTFNLHYDFSDLVNKNASGVTVRVNGELVDGILFFDKQTDQQLTREIPIPATYLFEGENVIQFVINLVPINICMNEDNLNPVWFTVFNDSTANFDLIPATANTTQDKVEDLAVYPEILTKYDSLNPITFILPEKNQAAKENAAYISYELGTNYKNFASNVDVTYDFTQLNKNQEIIIGLPNEIPTLENYASVLPLEFDSNNQVITNHATVSYKAPVGVDVGYALIPMRNSDAVNTPIFLLGETQQGLKNSGVAFSMNNNEFFGNLGVVVEDEVYSYRVSMPREYFPEIADTTTDMADTTQDPTTASSGEQSTTNSPDEINLSGTIENSNITITPMNQDSNLDFRSPILQVAIISFIAAVGILIIPLFLKKKKK